MIYRILLYVVGVLLLSWGIVHVTIYFSLLSIGLSFEQYLKFVLTRYETYLIPLGLIIIMLTIYFDKTWKKIISLRKDR